MVGEGYEGCASDKGRGGSAFSDVNYNVFFSQKNVDEILYIVNKKLNEKYGKYGRPIKVTYGFIEGMMRNTYRYNYRNVPVMNLDVVNTAVSAVDTHIEQLLQNRMYSEWIPYNGQNGIIQEQAPRVLPKARFYQAMMY
jgi:hypothetical protein